MIFKYYKWNAVSKNWDDTKSYCTICSSKFQDKEVLLNELYKILEQRKLIATPLKSMFLTDNSALYSACFTLYTTINNRHVQVGKIEQIPNKHTDFKKYQSPFVSIPFTRGNRFTMPDIEHFFEEPPLYAGRTAPRPAPVPRPAVNQNEVAPAQPVRRPDVYNDINNLFDDDM